MSKTEESILKNRLKTLLKEARIYNEFVVEKVKEVEKASEDFNLKLNQEGVTYESLEPDIENNMRIARDHSLSSIDLSNMWMGIVELERVANLSGTSLDLTEEEASEISKVRSFMRMNYELIDGKMVLRDSNEMKAMFDFRVEDEKRRLKEYLEQKD